MEPEMMGSWGISDHPDCPQMTDVNQNRRGDRWSAWKEWRSRWRPEGGRGSQNQKHCFPYGEEKMNSYSLKY